MCSSQKDGFHFVLFSSAASSSGVDKFCAENCLSVSVNDAIMRAFAKLFWKNKNENNENCQEIDERALKLFTFGDSFPVRHLDLQV